MIVIAKLYNEVLLINEKYAAIKGANPPSISINLKQATFDEPKQLQLHL